MLSYFVLILYICLGYWIVIGMSNFEVGQVWSLKEKICHWDSSYSRCDFPSEVDQSLLDPVGNLSVKCFGRKEFNSYLDLEVHWEWLSQQAKFKQELKLAQDFQVLRVYGGLSYNRHFPNDVRGVNVGFGSKFQQKNPLGRAQLIKEKVEEYKLVKLHRYLRFMEPLRKDQLRFDH